MSAQGACTGPLRGRGIVVTRPLEQARRLAQRIAAAGGRPIIFPALAILEVDDTGPLDALIDRLDAFDLAIFISPTAVEYALHRIEARRSLPRKLLLAAVGPGSAQALRRHGVEQVLSPSSRHDSEGLLALPQLADVRGRTVVIFRGRGGRDLLRDTLIARGARVEYAECYRRARPAGDARALAEAHARGDIDAVTATSIELLRNLWDMAGGAAWLRETPLFVSHARIATAARALGFARVVPAEPGEDGLLAALIHHYAPADRPARGTTA